MEQNQLHSIAQSLFDAMAESTWKDQSLDAIEGHVQSLLAQLGNTVMERLILPKRIQEIEQQVNDGRRRCPTCDVAFQRHKAKQVRHLKTLFGNRLTLTRTQFCCPSCRTYPAIADAVLGLGSHQMTPRLATVTALCGASWSYAVASAFVDFLLGVEVCDKTVELITKDQTGTVEVLPKERLQQPPGVVTADGVLIHSREKDRWLEMKVASFFSQVATVSRGRRQVLDASFVGSAVPQWREFVGAVTKEAERRGLSGWEPVEFVSDGAEGIWQLQEMIFPQAKKRLDLYHSKCKIGERMKQAYGGSPKKEAIEEQMQEYLEKGMVEEAMSYLRKRVPRTESKKQAAKKLLGYLERHRERIPNYEKVKEEGGTVSSGLMEKANDLVVCRRMKEGEMHWTREGAAPVIARRQQFLNKHARKRTGAYEVAFCRDFFQ